MYYKPHHLGDGAYVSQGADGAIGFAANHHENVTVVIQREDMVRLMQYLCEVDPALASVMANQMNKDE